MQVKIKEFDVAMELKNNGIELEIRDNSGNHKGDLFITKTKLIWCKGRTTRPKGKEMLITEFIKTMNEREH